MQIAARSEEERAHQTEPSDDADRRAIGAGTMVR
jgi:hypothetical protein